MFHKNPLSSFLLALLFPLSSLAQTVNNAPQGSMVLRDPIKQAPKSTALWNNGSPSSEETEEKSDLPTIEQLDLTLDSKIPFEQSLSEGESDASIEPPNFCQGMFLGAEVGSLTHGGLLARCKVKEALQQAMPALEGLTQNLWCKASAPRLARYFEEEQQQHQRILSSYQLTLQEYNQQVRLNQKNPLNTYWTQYLQKNRMQCGSASPQIYAYAGPIFVIDSIGSATLAGNKCSKVALMHVRFIQGHLSFAKAPFFLGLENCSGLTSSMDALAQAIVSQSLLEHYRTNLLKDAGWKSPFKWESKSAPILNAP